jgi:hypothetical protein
LCLIESIGLWLQWQCPICLKNYALENVIIDPYFNRVTSLVIPFLFFLEFRVVIELLVRCIDTISFVILVQMRSCGEDVTEIEVKPDGSWRVKTKNESERRDLGDLAQWHFPDGTLCVPDTEVKSKMEGMKQIKQEGISEGHIGLKLGIRKNRNGLWEVSKPEDLNTSSDNRLQERFGNYEQKVIPMSSSATGSGRDGEDPSVNQDGGGNFDISTNGIEMDSISLNVDSAFGFAGRISSAQVGDAEVIVLSDSEGDDEMLISPESIYKKNRIDAGGPTFSVPPPPGIPDTYPEDPLGTGGTSCLGLFNGTDEFAMPLWQLPPGNQAGSGFQLFSPEPDVADGLVNLHHGSMACSSSMNGYTLAPDTAMGSANLVPDPSVGHSETDINDGLVDNPFASFGADDPSLQIFLPTRPSAVSVQTDMRDQTDVSNGVRTEDWISLRLGGDASGSNGEPVAPNGLNSRQQIPPGDGALDSLADTGLFPFDFELL